MKHIKLAWHGAETTKGFKRATLCKKDALKDQEICAWNDKSMASEIAGNMDWFRDGDKHYCTDCHSFDDDDNLILKP